MLKTAAQRPLAAAPLRVALEAIAGMQSDYEQAEALLALARSQLIDSASRGAYIAAAEGIHSDYEQNRVLAALVRAEHR